MGEKGGRRGGQAGGSLRGCGPTPPFPFSRARGREGHKHTTHTPPLYHYRGQCVCVSGVQWGDGQLTYKKMKVGVVRGVWGRKGGEVGPLAGPKNPWFCYQQGGKSGSWVKSMSFEGGPPNLLLVSLPQLTLPPLIKWPAQSRLPASPLVASECTPYLCCVCCVCVCVPRLMCLCDGIF